MSLFPCHSIKQGPGPGQVRATVGLSSWNLFAHNEGAFSKKNYLRESVLQWIYQRVTYSVKRKGSAMSGQEVFNSLHIEELMWTRTVAMSGQEVFNSLHIEELMWTRTVALTLSDQQIQTLLLSQKQKIYVCRLRVIKILNPQYRLQTLVKLQTTSFFLGPVACPHGLVIYQTHQPNAIVSRSISVKH